MTKGNIRMALDQEAELLSNLALRSKGHWGYDQKFLANCKTELTYTDTQLSSPTYCFQLADTGTKQIAGFFALHFVTIQKPELEALFVDPAYIGKGWGKRLLNAAVIQAKAQQAISISIQSDPFAENFYLANGAIKIGETESSSIAGRFLALLEISI